MMIYKKIMLAISNKLIVDELKIWLAYLLVIGSHGQRGFSRLFLGSVTDNVIRIATLPILLVRGSAI
jgi:nucleotide-binding universal stress UspA family protein